MIFISDMKVLVTGASGFIGGSLVAKLAAQGHEVFALLRPTASSKALEGLRYTRLDGDLLDPASLERACAGMDVIAHLAGMTAGRDRAEYFKFNAEGTRNLAQAAAKAGKPKLIYVSTQAAGGPSPGLTPKVESDPDQPVSLYGESKLQGERYLEELRGRLPFIILRPTGVYGPWDKNILLFFKMIRKNWKPVLPTRDPGGHKYYNFIYVDDFVDAVIQSFNAPDECFQRGERYYLTDGNVYTLDRVMTVIAESLQAKPRALHIPRPALALVGFAGAVLKKVVRKKLMVNPHKFKELIPDYWICSSQKARDHWNFKPAHTFETGIPKSLAWYKQNGWL